MADPQTAATANTNPSDDVARNAQTSTEVVATPLSKQEDENVKAPTRVFKESELNKPLRVQDVAADETKAAKPLEVGGNTTNTKQAVTNPLDDYPSYTYALTLFAMTKADFNNMVSNPNTFKPSKSLISTAGRYQDVRDKNFKEDFYFDSFKMTTVVGMSANSRGTNAITLDFTIIEPYGMTLLDRIMNVSMNELAAKNYLDIPYLLRLEFFGYDDQGNVKKITEQTKNFPIKLINFKIKASVKGSEYSIQAVPFNHGANLESVQALKTRLEITADTVKTFFQSTETTSADTTALDDSTRKETTRLTNTDAGAGRGSSSFAARDPRLLGATPASETVGSPASFTAAYNAWNLSSVKNGDSKFADQIRFVIDKDIANSKIADPKTTTVKRSGQTTANQESRSSSTDATSTSTLDTSKVIHSFEAGTTVNEIINAIIPNSDFFLKQVKDPSKDSTTKVQEGSASDKTVQEQAKPISMWKIVPSIKLKEFDSERNVWTKDITFHIGKYTAYQQRDPRLPKSPPPKAVKQYDYFYTGKNNAVINFDIDFNALYFTATQIDRGNTEATAGTKAKPDSDNKDSNNSVGGKAGLGAGERKVNTGSQMQTGVGGANNKSETQNAQSALQSIYTSAAGDMINLKMQIVGDPHFIKQDDLFVIADVSGSQDTFVSPQVQSLNMDSGEIYCYVTFKTPTDFNDSTGMYNLNSTNQYSTSEFSGYYRVLLVESEFRSGKFTQTLNLVRYPMQDSPNASATNNTSPMARDDKATTPQKNKTVIKATTVPDQPEVKTIANDTGNKGPDGTAGDEQKPPVRIFKESELNRPLALEDVVTNGPTKTVDEANQG